MKLDLAKFASSLGSSPSTHHGSTVYPYSEGEGAYRTWTPDESTAYSTQGLLASMKIDHLRNNRSDDHVILMLHYSDTGDLIQAGAVVQMESELSAKTAILHGTPSQIIDALESELVKTLGGDSSEGRRLIPTVVRRNAIATSEAVVV